MHGLGAHFILRSLRLILAVWGYNSMKQEANPMNQLEQAIQLISNAKQLCVFSGVGTGKSGEMLPQIVDAVRHAL